MGLFSPLISPPFSRILFTYSSTYSLLCYWLKPLLLSQLTECQFLIPTPFSIVLASFLSFLNSSPGLIHFSYQLQCHFNGGTLLVKQPHADAICHSSETQFSSFLIFVLVACSFKSCAQNSRLGDNGYTTVLQERYQHSGGEKRRHKN